MGQDKRVASYIGVATLLLIGAILGGRADVPGTQHLHTLLEVVASLLALFVGAVALVHFKTSHKNVFLYVGAGFLGAAFLDAAHGLVTSEWYDDHMASPIRSLAPWSWYTSRLFLACLMGVSWIVSERRIAASAGKIAENRVFTSAAVIAVATLALFAFVPLPRAYYTAGVVGRPQEFLLVPLFAVPLYGYLRNGAWRTDAFSHWVILSLLLNLCLQLFYMPFSHKLFDTMFDAAHLLKIMSYGALLVGLFFSMHDTFVQADRVAQTELRIANERLRAFVNNAGAVVYLKDLQGRYELINKRYEEQFGITEREILGKTAFDVFPRDLAESFHKNDLHVAASGEAREVVEVIPDETGPRTYMSAKFPVRDSSGQIVAVGGVSTNVTRLKRAQERFQQVVELSPAAMLMVDAEGRIKLVNSKVETYFGYTRHELLGQPVEMLIAERFRDAHGAQRAGFFAQPTTRGMGVGRDLFGLRKNGTEIPVEIGLAPIESDEGRCVLASIVDMTERKHHEEELRRSNQDLQQFAYVASHDLQEPLRMVSSYVQLLAERYQGQLDDDADEFIHFAVDGAHRMQALIQDLLKYSRVGSQVRQFESVSSDKVLDETLSDLQHAIRESHATISRGELPTVCADPVQLRQVLQNLIVNAITFRTQEPPAIFVGAKSQNGDWVFEVRDNGIGIDPEYHDRIFTIFQRLHSRAHYSGNGIGLAICKRILERHGGRMWLESVSGKGTTFFFSLPRHGSQYDAEERNSTMSDHQKRKNI